MMKFAPATLQRGAKSRVHVFVRAEGAVIGVYTANSERHLINTVADSLVEWKRSEVDREHVVTPSQACF